jgi:hypothetical protein
MAAWAAKWIINPLTGRTGRPVLPGGTEGYSLRLAQASLNFLYFVVVLLWRVGVLN